MTHLHTPPIQDKLYHNLNKSPSLPKTDVFQEYEANISNKQKSKDGKEKNKGLDQKAKMKNKTKSYELDQFDENYEEDFQPIAHTQLRNNTENAQKPYKGNEKMKGNGVKTKQSKNSNHQKQKTQGKSSMEGKKQQSNSNNASEVGRYVVETEKKFGSLNLEAMSLDALSRNNQQIRQQIKRYNDILTDIINKNLRELNSKKSKAISPQQTIKVLQEELKNNNKIEQMDLTMLKKLQDIKSKLDQGDKSNNKISEIHQEEAIQTRIKQIQKEISNLKFNVKNQSKKLTAVDLTALKAQTAGEITALKEKIIKIMKEFQKNEEKLNSLNSRQTELSAKIEEIAHKDKQASIVKEQRKQSEGKSKKYIEVKKKYDNLKAHITKTQQLWNAKCSVSAYENDGIKQKIKNLDLQIKNMEESVKQTYDKTLKLISESKAKTQTNQKTLEKIIEQMRGNSGEDQGALNKKVSMTNMKMLIAKKNSSHNVSIHATNNKEGKKDASKDQKQGKAMSQQSERNRVWRPQKILLEVQAKVQPEVRKSFDTKYLNEKEKEHKQTKDEGKKQVERSQGQNISRPLKINLNKKRAASDLAFTQAKQQLQISKNQDKINVQNQHPKKVSHQTNTVESHFKQPEQKDEEQINIKSRKFNLNIKNRKKDEGSTYLPSTQVQEKFQQPQTKPEQNTEPSKPMFKLKRKKQGEKKQLNDNQFLHQQ